jgi:hypothetical protein
MRLAQSQQQLQEMQQQLQAAMLEINNRGQVAQIREEGATRAQTDGRYRTGAQHRNH